MPLFIHSSIPQMRVLETGIHIGSTALEKQITALCVLLTTF